MALLNNPRFSQDVYGGYEKTPVKKLKTNDTFKQPPIFPRRLWGYGSTTAKIFKINETSKRPPVFSRGLWGFWI